VLPGDAISPSADFNNDGLVNSSDLMMWRNGFGPNSGTGDADGDGDTDGSDFLLWQQQLGSNQSPPQHAAVPEPTSVGLAVLGFMALLGVRRRM
jgi:hypothetical protein